jgi:hypothetical protein
MEFTMQEQEFWVVVALLMLVSILELAQGIHKYAIPFSLLLVLL